MDNNQKYKWPVLEAVEWRTQAFEPGSVIEDTNNSFMRAMAYQGKVDFPEELQHLKK